MEGLGLYCQNCDHFLPWLEKPPATTNLLTRSAEEGALVNFGKICIK